MIVLVLEKVPTPLRGELTRWLLEISTGVFIGTVSAIVRDLLWEKCCARRDSGNCVMAHRVSNEQGFSLRMQGESTRRIVDCEGLQLIGWTTARAVGYSKRRTKRLQAAKAT